jgi:uncharacterized protein (DUF1778 family)
MKTKPKPTKAKPKAKVKKKPGRPATGHTPKRYFRISDADWRQIVKAARISRVTNSDFMRQVLLQDSAKVLKR